MRGETAGAGGVDDQQDLALEPLQRNVFAGQRCRGEIMMPAIVLFQSPSRIDLADRIDRRRRRAAGLDRLAGEQAQILAVAAGNQLDADRNAPDQSRGDR